MTTAPVLWVSRHHPEIIARGYADSGLLEALLAGELWRPPYPVTFEHHEALGDEWPEAEGAVVVLPARHHASDDDVAWFLDRLDRLAWSLVILAGDEEWTFPWRRVPETPTRRVWTMQPIPEHRGLSGLLPGGWSPGTPEGIALGRCTAPEKPLDWFFAGQVTHERRRECVAALRGLRRSGWMLETAGYMQGIDRDEYRALIAQARVVPCPSGPFTVDTNRPLEALEAGAVPVVDTLTPRGADYDYWGLVFGDHPLTSIRDWARFGDVLRAELGAWPANANRCSSWWVRWKRDATWEMHRQVQSLLRGGAGLWREEDGGPDDAITVVITTSPIPSHPDTAILEATVDSVREHLPDAEVVVVCDGVRPEDGDRATDYGEYVRRVCWLAQHCWHNVVPLVLDRWCHQAQATERALALARTPLVLFAEHDTPLTADLIDWPALVAACRSGAANAVRFHIYDDIHPEHTGLMLDDRPQLVEGAPLLRTVQWWQRPHLARADWYWATLAEHFPPDSRTMIEDVLYGIIEADWIDQGEAGWERWRTWVYAPEGGYRRSLHLDGRAGATKHAMYHPHLDQAPA